MGQALAAAAATVYVIIGQILLLATHNINGTIVVISQQANLFDLYNCYSDV